MRILLTIGLALFTHVVHAKLNVAAVFSDHAVVQRDKPLTVWGTTNPDARVSLEFANAIAETVANEQGNWHVTLKEQSASALPQTLVVRSGTEKIKRSDILVGDVWHACGQSNMGMTVAAVIKSMPNIEQRVRDFEQPGIRFLKIAEGPSRTLQTNFTSDPQWTVCADNTVGSFSAAAFFFAVRIHAEIGVPIGVIDSSRGGTPIEPFIPVSAFEGHPTLERERELGENDDLEGIWRLTGGVRARSDVWLPGRLFNSRLSPIADFAATGVIWYQGESNCGVGEDPRQYQHKMRALVRGWRQELRNSELPFYFVQLPGFGPGANWPYLREQQRLAAGLTNTGMVVTIDLEHPGIHPPNKLDVGDRLARWALARTYGRNIAFSGPIFKQATINGDQVIVHFQHADSGLMIANKSGLDSPAEQKEGALNHFEITSDENIDGGITWHPAKAEIRDTTVVVSADGIVAPVAVRYAYSPAPTNSNLFNRDGLPASPFCSRPELLSGEPK
ncbi:MAG: sialate O-acetylesterase [Pirellulaceae bacterium]